MRARRISQGVAAAALLAGLTLVAGGPAAAPAQDGRSGQRPNVVVIQSDDQSLEMMRVMRKTRRLVGRRGATFRNHFTNWPLCCPARATLLTGQYAHNHGVLGNRAPLGGYARLDRDDNLAVWLNEVGYEVGHVGKYLNGYGQLRDDPRTPFNDASEVPPGWTDWRTTVGASVLDYYDYELNEWSEDDGGPREATLVPYGTGVRDYKEDVFTAHALQLIERYAGRGKPPFYLQLDNLAPHSGPPRGKMPHPPRNCGFAAKPAPRHAHAFDDEPVAPRRGPSFDERDVSDKPLAVAELPRLKSAAIQHIRTRYRCRLESMLAIDDGVARIVRALRAAGELANTYVIYTSDNGFFHGEHRIRGGKNRVYEPAIRVPLVVRGPGIRRGIKVRDLTSNADLARTVSVLTGARSHGSRPPDGRSLLPSTRHPRTQTGRELLIETNEFAAVRTQRYKWVEYFDESIYGEDPVELYDLKRDPHELRNVAGWKRYRSVRSALARRLAALRDCAARSCKRTLQLRLRHRLRPGKRSCVRRKVVLAVGGADAGDLHAVRALVGPRQVAVDHRAPFKVRVRRRDLRRRRPVSVRVEASTIDGRRAVRNRAFRACK